MRLGFAHAHSRAPAAHLSFMRIRRLQVIAVLVVGFVVMLVTLYRSSQGPFERKLAGIEPSGILDDGGNEFILVDLQIVNRSIGLSFARVHSKTIEVKVTNRWIEAKETLGHWNRLAARRENRDPPAAKGDGYLPDCLRVST